MRPSSVAVLLRRVEQRGELHYIEQANLDLKAGNVAQGFILRYIKEKSVGNQAKSFVGLARQFRTGEVKGDWIPVSTGMTSETELWI